MSFKNYSNKTNKDEVNYNVIKEFGQLSENGKYVKKLRLVSWNNGSPSYDLRTWIVNEDGSEKASKGLTLSAEELQSLFDLLTEMNEDESEDD